ncbi:MAG: type VI secretion system contractile sheath large subunit, partial [Pseudomonadota bacterium]|nr:type VI secretion system contractile sheath large subunit [Pseudomonadota bacterium]
PAARANARLSAMLHYILCAARFAHYLKIIGREKVGAFARAAEMETYLHDWLKQYTTARDSASFRDKARYPLREARVQVTEHPGKPGCFRCVALLRPHYQLEQLSAAIRLETEITPSES